ncbi:MAG: VTT domain-containing protein [Steroidobacteraceae bacterium]|nr:VTT domain-containing protein [Steroidobacteraceae bacterium]MCW5572340.1 VTT domain-containing protein [Steroidobacteraceae bacterium]
MERAIVIRRATLPAQHRVVWRRAAVLGVLTLALAALASSKALHSALIEVLAASEDLIAGHAIYGMLLFVLLAAFSAMLAFMSVAVILPVAVFAWGSVATAALLWIGWLLGGACSYAIGRYVGRGMVKWLIAGNAFHRLENHLGPGSPFGLVLLLQFALPSEIPGYVLGLVRYSFLKYLLALSLAELLFAAAMVSLGAGFIEQRTGAVLGFGIVLVLFGLAAFYRLRNRLS